MSDNVIRLGAHSRMTPEEALAFVSSIDWDQIIICGYAKGADEFLTYSSNMTRECGLWIIEHAKLHVLDRL